MEVLGAVIVGALVNWVRAPKSIPIVASYAVAVVIGVGVYWLVSPGWFVEISTDPRAGVESFVMWVASALGFGRAGADTPGLNTLMPGKNTL